MTLQSSGPISLHQINVELGLSGTATISLNDPAVRKLLEKPSGTISMYDAYGKSHEIRFVNTTNRTTVNLYQLMGSPTEVANYVFENNAEIAASSVLYGLRTGVFPAGSTLTIINNSYIRGKGGSGSSAVDTPGGAGGDAIILDMACHIDNTNGYILAGGGGGGSAQRVASDNSTFYVRAGGGGGAGSSAGAAGVNTNVLYNNNPPKVDNAPQAGTATAGGAGGTISAGIQDYYIDTAIGGAGGTNGAAGAVGSTTTETMNGSSSYKNTPTIGVAGAAGRAIITNGKTLTQIAGFNSTQVKGAIV